MSRARRGGRRQGAERGDAEETIVEPPGVAGIAGAEAPGFAAQGKPFAIQQRRKEQLELSLARQRRLHRLPGALWS